MLGAKLGGNPAKNQKSRDLHALEDKGMDETMYWIYMARFWVGGGCRCDLCDKSHWAAPHWTQVGPAGFKMESPLAKPEPISDSGGASVVTYLRKAKKCCEREE